METVLSFLRSAYPDAITDALTGGAPERLRASYGIDATALSSYAEPAGQTSGLSATSRKVLGKGLDILRTMAWVRRHDVVIVPGAGPLEISLPVGTWGFPLNLFIVTLSGRLFGTKVALVSVGADDIKKRTVRWLSNATARLAYYRSYRDDHSLAAMQRRGIDTAKGRVYPDLVFGVPTPPYEPGDISVVGVGVMAYYGSNDDREHAADIHAAYVEKMTTFVDWLVSDGHKIRIFGGDSKFDWEVADQIMGAVRRAHPDLDAAAITAERVSSYAELIQLITPVGTVVATRYHNVMCALKLRKPTISLGYSRKFVALMTEMGVAEFNQFADSFEVEQLIEQFQTVKKRHAELQQQMAERNEANRHALDAQFAELDAELFRAG